MLHIQYSTYINVVFEAATIYTMKNVIKCFLNILFNPIELHFQHNKKKIECNFSTWWWWWQTKWLYYAYIVRIIANGRTQIHITIYNLHKRVKYWFHYISIGQYWITMISWKLTLSKIHHDFFFSRKKMWHHS